MSTVKELEKENAALKEQVEGLTKRIKELEEQKATARPSKSRVQAEQVKAILDKAGFVTKEQLTHINEKYPSDPIYYAKNLLGVVVVRKDGVYFTPKALEAYEAEKAKAPAVAPATQAQQSA